MDSNFYPRPPRGGRRPSCAFTTAIEGISIHALREEGDSGFSQSTIRRRVFLSTPSARRATFGLYRMPRLRIYFYPRPPRGGRPSLRRYYSTSSSISIHALREEGDGSRPAGAAGGRDFYPRPPRGGRLNYLRYNKGVKRFLSTPSARRATAAKKSTFSRLSQFLSTPSARRATKVRLTM